MPGLRLEWFERELIARGCREGRSFAAVARRLGRPTSTVAREVARHGGREGYQGWLARHVALRRARRPRPARPEATPDAIADEINTPTPQDTPTT